MSSCESYIKDYETKSKEILSPKKRMISKSGPVAKKYYKECISKSKEDISDRFVRLCNEGNLEKIVNPNNGRFIDCKGKTGHEIYNSITKNKKYPMKNINLEFKLSPRRKLQGNRMNANMKRMINLIDQGPGIGFYFRTDGVINITSKTRRKYGDRKFVDYMIEDIIPILNKTEKQYDRYVKKFLKDHNIPYEQSNLEGLSVEKVNDKYKLKVYIENSQDIDGDLEYFMIPITSKKMLVNLLTYLHNTFILLDE